MDAVLPGGMDTVFCDAICIDMKATPGQIKRIHSLLPQEVKNDRELKEDLVYQYTKDRNRTSTKELEVGEAKSMISDLLQNHPDNRMRKKFLSMCHEMQWYHEGTTALDWTRIGNWLLKYGHKHTRDLNAYHGKELSTLVTQFERVLESSYVKELKQSAEGHK